MRRRVPDRRDGADAIRRRAFLALSGATALALGRRAASAADADTPLRTVAGKRGIRFGSEVLASELDSDKAYRALVRRECASVTPGLEAKWNAVEPVPGRFRFGPLDDIVDFASADGIAVRMHTLLWGLAMPPWLDATLRHGTATEAEAALRRHVVAVAGRYRGRVAAWDVCNELSDPLWHRGPEGLTLTPWRLALGPAVVPLSFRLVREADPGALLFVNEDGLEWRGRRFDEKRATYLRLVEGWRRDGVPIDGFGLQTHLGTADAFDAPAYRRFLAELAGFGLTLHLTELDVRDRSLPADPAQRDRLAADLLRRVLDVALDERAVRAVTTWGLSDRYTYADADPEFRRPDGLRSRPLPFDDALRPKPMRDALARAFAAAPDRSPSAPSRSVAAAPAGRSPLPL